MKNKEELETIIVKKVITDITFAVLLITLVITLIITTIRIFTI